MNIKYFFITNRVRTGEMTIRFCPTGEMVADHFTKPLQGQALRKFRAIIMNLDPSVSDCDLSWDRAVKTIVPSCPRPQECVGPHGIVAKRLIADPQSRPAAAA